MYTVKLPGYSIGGAEVYQEIGNICRPFGTKVAVLGGETALSKAWPALAAALQETDLVCTGRLVYGDECSYAVAERLQALPEVAEAEMLFAVGGGKAIDTVKIIAGKTGRPFFTFPTLASTCAAVTSIAAVYTEDHRFEGVFDVNQPPVHTFIHEGIIAEAPAEYLWAGIGDSLAKYYESRLSARGRAVGHGNELGVCISGMCAAPLQNAAIAGYQSCLRNEVTPELRETVLNCIVSTGFASVFLDPDYNSAIAHSLTYGLVELPAVEKGHMHGEIVAYGVLILLLMDEQQEEFEHLYRFHRGMGLPTSLADLDVRVDELEPVLAKAVTTYDLNVLPYRVTEDMFRNAILALEDYDAAQKEAE